MISDRPAVVCLGGATVDRTYQSRAPLLAGTSNPVSAAGLGFGGVARNVAESLARLGVPAALVSIVGDDEAGRAVLDHVRDLGVTTRLSVAAGQRTAEYVAVLQPSGELAFGLANLAILDAFTPSLLEEAWSLLSGAVWVVADCNLPSATLADLIERRRAVGVFGLAIDAVSAPKAKRLPGELAGVDLLFANVDEARAILGTDPFPESPEDLCRAVLARGAGAVVITLGDQGLFVAETGGEGARLPAVAAQVVNVTGGGDALIAGTLSRLLEGERLVEALRAGLSAASLTVACHDSVRPDLSRDLLQAAMGRKHGR